MAWRGALAQQRRWDFFLLMNDDTEFLPDAFTSLMSAHRDALKTHGKGGVYSGVCSSSDGSEITAPEESRLPVPGEHSPRAPPVF